MKHAGNGHEPVATYLQLYHFEDDGVIPNSKYPVLHYLDVFMLGTPDMDMLMEERFAQHNWSNTWRNGVYPFHHYHSITHEVMGIYAGSAILQLGGKKGKEIEVQEGEVLVIPAGVAHKKISADAAFRVLGAYPGAANYDLIDAEASLKEAALQRIKAVPIPDNDPVLGEKQGLCRLWK